VVQSEATVLILVRRSEMEQWSWFWTQRTVVLVLDSLVLDSEDSGPGSGLRGQWSWFWTRTHEEPNAGPVRAMSVASVGTGPMRPEPIGLGPVRPLADGLALVESLVKILLPLRPEPTSPDPVRSGFSATRSRVLSSEDQSPSVVPASIESGALALGS